jgi:hypothetical protein
MCGCSGILGYLFQFFKNNVMYILGMQNVGVQLCVKLRLEAELCACLSDMDVTLQ